MIITTFEQPSKYLWEQINLGAQLLAGPTSTQYEDYDCSTIAFVGVVVVAVVAVVVFRLVYADSYI